MKTTTPSRPASAASTPPASAATTVSSSARSAAPIDYRANVERQSREQKSVGSLLAYLVYSLIGLFVIGALLAGYGASVVFKQIHDQSVTVGDLEQRYDAANKDLSTKLQTTQDALVQAQAQITRQQDLILKQQDDLNRLTAATTDNANALKAEKSARVQETVSRSQDTSNLRTRLRELEYKVSANSKY